MSNDNNLHELYRKTVLEHSRQPRNFRRIEHADQKAEGHNPLCGDKINLYLNLDNDHLADVAYEASGCAISLASASMMTEQMTGLEVAAARQHTDEVIAAFSDPDTELPGELTALGGVRAYPSRIRCALLPWRTLRAGLDAESATVNTESSD